MGIEFTEVIIETEAVKTQDIFGNQILQATVLLPDFYLTPLNVEVLEGDDPEFINSLVVDDTREVWLWADDLYLNKKIDIIAKEEYEKSNCEFQGEIISIGSFEGNTRAAISGKVIKIQDTPYIDENTNSKIFGVTIEVEEGVVFNRLESRNVKIGDIMQGDVVIRMSKELFLH